MAEFKLKEVKNQFELPEFKLEEVLFRFRYTLLFLFLGIILATLGILFLRKNDNPGSSKIEILNTNLEDSDRQIVVEISGAVESPGVYQLTQNDRVEDALILAGGISSNADRTWIEKFLNRAAKLSDGQKIYIPPTGETAIGLNDKHSDVLSAKNNEVYKSESSNLSALGERLVNINTATLKELDTLPGIGPVYGQNIIEQRPYSNIEELLTKNVLRKSTFEKIKERITIY